VSICFAKRKPCVRNRKPSWGPRTVVIEFLRLTLLFNELRKNALEELAAGSMIGFHPKDKLVLQKHYTLHRCTTIKKTSLSNILEYEVMQ
jgi:hypothetical protein